MHKTIIKTDKAPLPIGPYNQGVAANGFVFTAGQVPVNQEIGKIVSGTFKDRVNQVFNNLEQILIAADSKLENVVKFTIFLTDMNRYAEVNEVFNQWFTDGAAPARSLVEVTALPGGADVEMECVALLNK